MRLALLGAGGIASAVARAVVDGLIREVDVVAVAGATADSTRARELAAQVGARAVVAGDLVDHHPEVVLEAAGPETVRRFAAPLLDSGAHLVVMSIGALLDDALRAAVLGEPERASRVVLPSGGIAGLDAVRALGAVGALQACSLSTTKAPRGLAGAPYLVEGGIDVTAMGRTVVFEGSAREAVRGFPANANVAAALSLAGLGPDRTRVTIVSDPEAPRTRHEIDVEGEGVRLAFRIASEPSPANPRTSVLAAASAVEAVRRAAAAAAST